MIDLVGKLGASALFLAGLGADAPRPPVEAAKPAAVAETPNTDAGNADAAASTPNSGGPGSPAEEGGERAPAAEPVGPQAAGEKPRRGIWIDRATGEQPKPLLAEIAGGTKPGTPDPVAQPRAIEKVTALDRQVDEAIDVTSRRVLIAEPLDPRQRPHTPWQIGHGMLAFRRDYLVRVRGEKVNAYEWVANNPVYRARVKRGKDAETRLENLNWFYLTPYGARPQRFTGEAYEFEGHPNQFLAFFALARLPREFEFTVQGRKVTFGDMLNNAKMEVNDREEVTWDLWTFAFYFDPDEQWRNAKGEAWSMERLVSLTMTQFANPKGAPCGGCHALFALASARNAYFQTKGTRLTGAWTRAHYHLEKHIELARQLQNSDGSFSGDYFKGRKYVGGDPSKRISTTGHTLEFLMMALKQDRLNEPWVRNAVNRLSRDLIEFQAEPLEPGGMYHAAHALVLYRERTRPQFVASSKGVTPAGAVAAPVVRSPAEPATVKVSDAPSQVDRKTSEPMKLEPVTAEPTNDGAGRPEPTRTAEAAKEAEKPKAEVGSPEEPRKLDDSAPGQESKSLPAAESGSPAAGPSGPAVQKKE